MVLHPLPSHIFSDSLAPLRNREPWVLDLGDHREISGNAVTPTSNLQDNEARFDCARQLGGVFCAATHYWELDTPCIPPNSGTVGEQLQRLVERAKSDPQVVWRSVGDIVSADA